MPPSADPEPDTGPAAGGHGDPEPERRLLRSVALLACNIGAVAIAVLVLFGLGPPVYYLVGAGFLVVLGLLLGAVDGRQEHPNAAARRVAVFGLVVACLSLLVAVFAFVHDLQG